jgi:hypothetical protein
MNNPSRVRPASLSLIENVGTIDWSLPVERAHL